MRGIVAGDLVIDVVHASPDLIEVFWSGSSNAKDPAVTLRPFTTLLLAEAKTRSARVELHFEKLSFINSSTVSALIRFLQDAAGDGVKVALFYDGALRWQEHNFKTISLLHGPRLGLEVHRLDGGVTPEKVRHL
ncbi:MAG: hypothetical protein IAE78_01980 [Myxococcus sp.]|nr:hypothetical protein [Myxococcus sp.]